MAAHTHGLPLILVFCKGNSDVYQSIILAESPIYSYQPVGEDVVNHNDVLLTCVTMGCHGRLVLRTGQQSQCHVQLLNAPELLYV